MKTIIAALDFSNSTPGVLEMAGGIAKAYGASLHLLHVMEPEPTYTAYGFTPDEFPVIHEFQEEAKKRAQIKLEEAAASVRHLVPDVTVKVDEGNPLPVILEYIHDVGGDMVVLGTHGHGMVASLLLGSVAEGLVRKAAVPTLVVPAPQV
jgi:nucleotide-binding universal stress UspA family protein